MSLDVLRIVFSSLGDIEEWKLADPERAKALGYPRRFEGEIIDDWATLFLDITLDAADGRPVCHEVNGPNGVGSDALTGTSAQRALAEARQAVQRTRELGCLSADGRLKRSVVTVHAHQHWNWFRTGGEFYPRVERFAASLRELCPGAELALRGASEVLGGEDLSVVMGDVPAVAAGLALDPATRRFQYQGRPVIFIGNPNLLTELIRTGKLPEMWTLPHHPAVRVLHGGHLLAAIQDKCFQQTLFRGTSIRPLRHFQAGSLVEAGERARAMLAAGAVVVKPNGTSGGTGVQVLTPEMSAQEIGRRLDELVGECVRKYGVNTEATIFPLRGFEFVRSTGYPLADGERLWDLRIGLHLEPGTIHAYPVSMRLAPEPFRAESFHLDRDQWVSNVSGRQSSSLLSGMDAEALAAVGLRPERLDSVLNACATWAMKAWDACGRGEGAEPAYEDTCEALNPDFYPRDKFRTSGSFS